jgi:hypothetical protein
MKSSRKQVALIKIIFIIISFIFNFSCGICDSQNPEIPKKVEGINRDFTQAVAPSLPDRDAPQLCCLSLDSGIRDLGRNSSTSYTLNLVNPPIIAHIQARLFHQGTDATLKRMMEEYERTGHIRQ